MKRIVLGAALAVASLFAPTISQAQEQAFPASGIEPMSINCAGGVYSTGGAGTLFDLCVSDHGNMVNLEYPAGFDHINFAGNGILEGYVVCATNPAGGIFNYFDFAAFGEAGFGAPVVLDAAPFPVTIRRTSTDSRIILDQKFVPNKTGRTMTITMTVTNNTTTTLNGVQIARIVDPDMDGTGGGDVFDRSTEHTWARETRSLVLAAPTISATHTTAVHVGPQTAACATATVATPAAGDLTMRIWYDLGSIAPGKKKFVTFRYNGA